MISLLDLPYLNCLIVKASAQELELLSENGTRYVLDLISLTVKEIAHGS